MRPAPVIFALWIAFCLSWIAAAGWSGRTDKRVGLKGELAYRIILVIGGVSLFVRAHGFVGPLRLWFVGRNTAWGCAALVACGFAFSWWARIRLGALWSGAITRKEGHRIIDTGPYAIVRHPIYTGILLAVFATAAVKGMITGIVGALLITLGISMKARLEERWLREELDPDAYDGYRRRVPMLIPFGPK
jgi:protein-S-isoprenylcysteine O-methyltransferase Ste14